MPYHSAMQQGDGYQYDGGPSGPSGPSVSSPSSAAPSGSQGAPQQPGIPVGSRLNQYLKGGHSVQGPSFSPGTPINVNAPVFVPKHQQPQQTPPQPPPQMLNQFANLSIRDVPIQVVPFHSMNGPPQPYPPHINRQHHPPHPHTMPPPPIHPTPPPPPPPPQLQHSHQPHLHSQHPQHPHHAYQQESRGGTVYFYSDAEQQQIQQQAEDEFVEPEIPEGSILVTSPGSFGYSAPLPLTHMTRFRGKPSATLQTQFVSPEVRAELINRQLAFDTKADSSMYPDLPQAVEHYSNLVPLENVQMQNQSQSTYKAFSCRDGSYYCLRRIHGFRVQHPGKQTHTIEQWKKLAQGNVITLREVLINCRAFDDTSLIFVYDYYPLAETLLSRHFRERNASFFDMHIPDAYKLSGIATGPPIVNSGLPEPILWSYIVQISNALRAIHSSGLACRSVELSKIVAYGGKIMLAFCGLQDMIGSEAGTIHNWQNEDLIQFGNLVVQLCTGRPNGARKDLLVGSMNFIKDTFSVDVKAIISFLHNTGNSSRRSINEIHQFIGNRYMNVIENMQARTDLLEAELCREMENGRLFRLLAKMNTVLERAEHGTDESWSETGDRFMLKLYRDFIFHQVTDQGRAWLDMAHIVQCLNKLDAGSQEKIEMVSRSGDTQIIIDYATLKRCLEKSFRELQNANLMHRPH